MPQPLLRFFYMKLSDKDSSPKILLETSHVLVVYKPSGWVVPIEHHPKNSLEGYLKEQIQKRDKKKTIFLRPLHRLDKPVEGLVLFAKSSKGLKRLQSFQREGRIEKFYVAKVKGKVKKKCGKLVHNLQHGSFRALIVEEGGKKAVLRYRVLNVLEKETYVSIYLLTGRYHQIRAQWNAVGHPINKDDRYEQQVKASDKQIDLCHTHLSFPDPITQKRVHVRFRSFHF